MFPKLKLFGGACNYWTGKEFYKWIWAPF